MPLNQIDQQGTDAQIAGFDTPTKSAKVRPVMAGILRTKGTAADAKIPVMIDDLKKDDRPASLARF